MPQVPFSGVPSVAPELNPTPRYEANVRPESFGVNVAQAVQGMGNTLQSAGNEMFARGVAMQDLNNHTQALEADTKYSMAAGQIWEKLKSLEGKNATDYYTSGDYQKELEGARKSIRDGLPNDMARKLYDSSTLPTFTRTNLYGAGHAGSENRKYAADTAGAKVEESANQALANPTDSNLFNQSVSDTERDVEAMGQLRGWGPERLSLEKERARSNLWAQRIKGLSKTQPDQAQKMLDEATKGGVLQGEDIAKTTNLVQQANHTVGARMISHEVQTGAGLRWGDGKVDIKDAQQAVSKIESGSPQGNYNLIGPETRNMGHALGRYQVMSGNLQDWLTKSGLPSMTEKEFLANSKAQDQVFSTVFGGYMDKYGSANAAAVAWFAGEGRAADKSKWSDASITDATATTRGTSVPKYLGMFNQNLAQNAPLSAKYDMGQSIAAERAPNDPLFQDAVRDRIAADENRLVQAKRADNFNDSNTVNQALMGGQSGKLPTTVEELTADPKVAAAWERLGINNASQQRSLFNALTRNAKGDHNWTPDTMKQYSKLYGMAQTEPAEFVQQDIIGSELPNSAKTSLIRLQARLYGQAEGDPGVSRALRILALDMNAADIKNDKAGRDNYLDFTGKLADRIQDFMAQEKRPPKVDEIKLMGSQLMQEHITSKGLFWDTTTRMYKLPVPDDVLKQARKLNPALTDTQIQREYTRQKYQQLYGGSVKPQTKQASGGPSVSVSQ